MLISSSMDSSSRFKSAKKRDEEPIGAGDEKTKTRDEEPKKRDGMENRFVRTARLVCFV